jgi:hypothetical protein
MLLLSSFSSSSSPLPPHNGHTKIGAGVVLSVVLLVVVAFVVVVVLPAVMVGGIVVVVVVFVVGDVVLSKMQPQGSRMKGTSNGHCCYVMFVPANPTCSSSVHVMLTVEVGSRTKSFGLVTTPNIPFSSAPQM